MINKDIVDFHLKLYNVYLHSSFFLTLGVDKIIVSISLLLLFVICVFYSFFFVCWLLLYAYLKIHVTTTADSGPIRYIAGLAIQ